MNHDDTTPKKQITLQFLADHLGLTAGTISAVLNDTPAAFRIPQATKDRILAAAREFNYQPNALARALRAGHAVSGATASETINPRGALVIVGADQFLGRAIHAIQQAGLRVPGDVTVVGFDGFPIPALDSSATNTVPEPT